MNKLNITIHNSIKVRKKLIDLKKNINKAIELIFNAIKANKKIYICGNGGSAAEAQHFAAEFLVRLNPSINRKPLPIISLALDTSTLTACGNDYNFNNIFSRNLIALGQKEDVLICLSTSGNSRNILNVLKTARQKKIKSLCFLGDGGGKAKKLSNLNIIIPSKLTALIQEEHLFLGHFILNEVEKKLIKNNKI